MQPSQFRVEITLRCDLCLAPITKENEGQTTAESVVCIECLKKVVYDDE